MGIRIHKVVGYGLTDVTPADPRIRLSDYRPRFEELDFMSDGDIRATLADLHKRARELWPAVNGKAPCYAIEDFDKVTDLLTPPTLVHKDSAEGVVLFVPIGVSQWYRYDDTLDWIEDTALHEQRDRVVLLKRPPFPFEKWVYKDGSGVSEMREWMLEKQHHLVKPVLPVELLMSVLLWEHIIPDVEALCHALKPLFFAYWE